MPEHVEEVVLGVAPAAEPVPGRVRAHEPRHAAPHDAKNGEGAAEADRRGVPPDPWCSAIIRAQTENRKRN